MNEIKAVFAARYGALLRMFDYYCCVGGQVGRGAFAISENAFLDLCKKCAIPDPHCTVEDIGKIFIAVNFETDKKARERSLLLSLSQNVPSLRPAVSKSADADVNEDKALMRHELLECFVRIAVAKYVTGSKELDDVSEAVDRLLCVIFDDEPGLPPEAKHDPDGFRTERLFLEPVDDVVKTHYRPLRMLYDKCVPRRAAARARNASGARS